MNVTDRRGLGLIGAALMVGITIGSWTGAGQPESAAQMYATATATAGPVSVLTGPNPVPTRLSAQFAPDNTELDRIVSTHEARLDALETQVARP